MKQRYRNLLMWTLYGALFLAVLLIQTQIFGRIRFFGAKLCFLPMVVICVGVRMGHEAGGVYGLLTGLVWASTGADDGILCILSFTLLGILGGWLCDAVFPRKLLPAVGLSLLGLLLHLLADFLLKYYLHGAPLSLLAWVPLSALCSLPAAPVLYGLANSIGKVGNP